MSFQFSIENFINYLLGCRCLICNKKISSIDLEQLICNQCLQLLPKFSRQVENACKICALPIVKELTICKYCENGELEYLDKTLAGYIYDFPVRNLILKLKSTPNRAIAKFLITELLNSIIDLPSYSVENINQIIPMPIHDNRLSLRGFNQSIVLAKLLAKQTGIPVNINLVNKIKDNGVQEGRTRKQRFQNIKNSFNVSANCQNQNYILIDDVMTTGASINELARVLKKQGANSCNALVVCRAVL